MITYQELEAMTSEQIMEIFSQESEKNCAATAAVKAAIKSYYSDIKKQEDAIEARKVVLNKEMEGISVKIEAMRPALVKATAADDTAALDALQRDFIDLEAKRAALSVQIKLLSDPLPANTVGYQAVYAAIGAKKASDKEYIAICDVIREYCDQVIKPWQEIREKASKSPPCIDRWECERMNEHYNKMRNTN